MGKLDGKVSIITGGAGGIGSTICKTFVHEGSIVIIVDLEVKKAENLVEEIKNKGGKADFFLANTTKKNDVIHVVNETIKHYGKIDVLVNTAGINIDVPIELLSEEDWERGIDINLKGTFLFCKYVGLEMIKRRNGVITNFASLAGIYPQVPGGPYSAAKAGVILLTKQMAVEWGKYNVRVNTISPGPIATPMTQKHYEDPVFYESRIASIPLNRFGSPQDVANAVLFLSSADSSFITAENLIIDGGSQATIYASVNIIKDLKKALSKTNNRIF